MVSRWAHNSKVGGSKPLSAIFLFFPFILNNEHLIALIKLPIFYYNTLNSVNINGQKNKDYG